jgi:hypothetical protein
VGHGWIKKTYADTVRSAPKSQSRSIFMRLNYPKNYHLNYLGTKSKF